jgi:hypothetical protein
MVIDGRFELLARLGAGGMGTVWRAKDLALHREVALKEVRFTDPAAESDPDIASMLRERVMREARALARLDHPNVVTIHHIVDGPGMAHPWIVMELVRGQSLEDRLEQGPLSPAEAAEMGRGVLGALSCAHEAGICHRDVKPGNVLLRHDGRPVLTDFGIAAISDWTRVTATGGLVGSPAYIAPERLHGEEGNPSSDLWSLGMLLYVAVEGHNPMYRATTAATLAAVLKGEVPEPRQAGALTPVLAALLVPNPADRPDPARLDHLFGQAAAGLHVPFTRPFTKPVTGGMPHPGGATSPGMGGAPYPGAGGATYPGAGVPAHAGAMAGTNPGTHPGTHPAMAPPKTRRRPRLSTWLPAGLVLATVGAIIATTAFVVPRVMQGLSNRITGGLPGPTGLPGVGGPTAAGPGATGTQARNLLTPAAVRSVIGAIEKVSGTQEFTKFTVYGEYAFAEAPVRGKRNLYDKYTYRGGQAARDGAGGTLSADSKTVKLRSLNWDALPTLMRRAERSLGVPKPKLRYVIVDPSWTFAGDKPTMLIYLTDDYGGAYLAADRQGKVIRAYPREG